MNGAPRSSARSRAQARAALRRRLELERALDKQVVTFGRRLRSGILVGLREGKPLATIMAPYADEFAGVVMGALLVGHATGGIVVAQRYAKGGRRPATQRILLDTADTAKRIVDRTLRYSPENLDRVRDMYERHARTVASDGLSQLGNRVAAIEDQTDLKAVRAKLDIVGIGAGNPHYMRTIVRTQLHLGYSAGKLDRARDPLVQAELWGYEYVAILDERVRPEHEALNGVVLPKEHPRWGSIMPPNGFNCRCDVIEVWNDENPKENLPETVEIDGEQVVPGPDPGWSFTPAQIVAG